MEEEEDASRKTEEKAETRQVQVRFRMHDFD